MKRLLFLAPVALAAVLAAYAAGPASAQEGPLPTPSAGSVLAGDLLQPRGVVVGPDGMLYVAEAGTGGDTAFTVGEGAESFVSHNGFTGRVSKIDPASGARTTVVDGLPSGASEEGEAIGVADIAFSGNNLYVLLTHAMEEYGFPDWSTGIYRVTAGGDTVLVADIGEFNKANPVDAITSGVQQDVEPGGNPYSMIERGGVFYVSDGNHNQLLKVTAGGNVTRVTEFPNHPVSTGIADTGSGPFYVSYLGQGPFLPDAGKVVRVDPLSGAITEVASGEPMITSVGLAGGTVYALQFNDTVEAGEAFFAPGTGSVLRVNPNGTFTELVSGLSFATDMAFDGNTLYVVEFGIAPIGRLIVVDDITAVTPVAVPTAAPTAQATQGPAATPTRGTGIGGPDTGSGGYLDDQGAGTPWVMVIVLAGLAATGTAALAIKRR